jgi:hypothetical protein
LAIFSTTLVVTVFSLCSLVLGYSIGNEVIMKSIKQLGMVLLFGCVQSVCANEVIKTAESNEINANHLLYHAALCEDASAFGELLKVKEEGKYVFLEKGFRNDMATKAGVTFDRMDAVYCDQVIALKTDQYFNMMKQHQLKETVSVMFKIPHQSHCDLRSYMKNLSKGDQKYDMFSRKWMKELTKMYYKNEYQNGGYCYEMRNFTADNDLTLLDITFK